MNYKNKQQENRRLKELIKNPYKARGINSHNKEEHEMVKMSIVYKLLKDKYEVFVESPLITGGIPDIIAIKGEHGFIVEILCSETEERFLSKQDYYLTGDFTVVKVYTNEYNPDTWAL